MKYFLLVALFIISCGNHEPTVNYIPRHLQNGAGAFFEISDSGSMDGVQFVKLRVTNDSVLSQYVVIQCEFSQQDRIISTNEVALRMRPYTWRYVVVNSSQRTVWGSSATCRVTEETHPLDYTVITKTKTY